MPVADVARRMLDSCPRDFNVDQDVLVRCIEACSDCAQARTQCADGCLSEQGNMEMLVKCIRLDLDCADICTTTERVISRQTEHGMEHCRVCAEECRRCEQACRELVEAIG